MQNVKFLPWVGKNYQYGILGYDDNGLCYGTDTQKGKKLLVLGESHWCENPDNAHPNITIDVITDLCNPDADFEPYKNTYTKFERALSGQALNKEQHLALWNAVMFYNFVQIPMTGPRKRPNRKDFKASEPAFFEVLDAYKPDYIIAWGYDLYDRLPQCGHQLPNIIAEDGTEAAVWGYDVGGKTIPLLDILHPAAGFTPLYWHNVIKKFLQDY